MGLHWIMPLTTKFTCAQFALCGILLALADAATLALSHRAFSYPTELRSSVTERYTNVVPPRAKNTLSSDFHRVQIRKSFFDKADEAVLFLDLDKTAIFGNDGNDLGMALQWMDKPQSVISSLYKKMINPSVLPAYQAMQKKARKVHVVLYTRRVQIVRYSSCFRDATIPVRYNQEWHKQDDEICFPSHVRTADDISRHYCGPTRLEEEEQDMDKALERIIAARDAIAEELGLQTPPQVVVTALEKDVARTATCLGLPRRNAFLFDDNEGIQDRPGVITVEPLMSLPAAERDALLSFMEEQLPVSECDDDLLDFLRGAKPGEEAIELDDDDRTWRWRVPLMHGAPPAWKNPEIVPEIGDGAMSPVTPSSEDQAVAAARSVETHGPSPRGVADLKVAVQRALELRKAASM